MLTNDTVATIRAQLRGRLLEPGDVDCDAARKVYNAMIDGRPRLLAPCRDVDGKASGRSIDTCVDNEEMLKPINVEGKAS